MQRYTDFESLLAARKVNKSDIVPPNCVKTMESEFVEYLVGKSITYDYPALEIFSNPRKAMQGGFIAAAFDNTFGSLTFLLTGKMEMATIDLSVSYHKPIFENDILRTTAILQSKGKTIVSLRGEAFDRNNNLIATSTTNIILLAKK
ncbi:MAG: PaaI family thioesterase [Syntrophomonadaceae bacterium]|nr:PaaI family thioesterase [Syntrophomonadaceae bacterium]MDD3022447.1 PaaI family thioesterase [Syntrophomonadaceae bacterium]